MASDDTQKYQKVIQWLLNNVNPELFEIQSTLQRVEKSLNLDCSGIPYEKAPTDLVQVLEQVELAERHIAAATRALVSTYAARKMPTTAPAEVISGTDKFEKLFARLLPRIDSSLSAIEEATIVINTNVTQLELEPVPAPTPNQTPMQRQVRFVDKAKRIRNNLALIGDALPSNLSEPQSDATIECLYEPPAWSTPPRAAFYFEVREGDQIIDKIPISVSGHYLIGRLPLCDIVVDDATCSRQHAVIQFRPGDPEPISGARADEVYIYDLGSTSGTFVNVMPLQPKAYYPLYKGDTLQFGQYSCAFVLRDGTEPGLTPPKIDGEGGEEKIVGEKISRQVTADAKASAAISKPEAAAAEKEEPAEKKAEAPEGSNDSEPAAAKEEKGEPEEKKADGDAAAASDSNQDAVSLEEAFDTRAEEVVKVDKQKLDKEDPLSKADAEVVVVKIKKTAVDGVDPHNAEFSEEDYKKKMIEAYEKQQRENEAILRRRKEREAAGLPPLVEIPYVPERPKRQSVTPSTSEANAKKKKRWWSRK
mmetsp:Transcript_870/g.3200  ORF Transcript_870/g.3200 Transcript_870/m.3200 type:complete len:534 (+) Transcript_870:167-1768(+)|eukprot:CAMPEP_0114614372 /NCGR_PEP_ID=MMETSP0168-20121206/5621_1 /TAXON_ID=95228 ORGANISM="Vannella sp., Strain DIVA3 517/6/12" /NCGR_SAMPLE_ID=MMETSP0168 /ASSEMBLY_ACC=CAM_ASM_000044 /LENGTH=533 /DNA_ID=CAMNT_0001825421 /DNA_START=155 /DNA_END=1756 /DNA_ORIENTATION=+